MMQKIELWNFYGDLPRINYLPDKKTDGWDVWEMKLRVVSLFKWHITF